jgi:hypothetical protein
MLTWLGYIDGIHGAPYIAYMDHGSVMGYGFYTKIHTIFLYFFLDDGIWYCLVGMIINMIGTWWDYYDDGIWYCLVGITWNNHIWWEHHRSIGIIQPRPSSDETPEGTIIDESIPKDHREVTAPGTAIEMAKKYGEKLLAKNGGEMMIHWIHDNPLISINIH